MDFSGIYICTCDHKVADFSERHGISLLQNKIMTDRMIFRYLNKDDVEAVHRQFSDPDMCKYFCDPPCDLQEAMEIIEHYQNPEGKGYLRYGMFDRVTEKFIGTCGYHYWDRDKKQVEIGYDIWKDYWKQGYLSEAMPVLLNFCFNHLHVDCIYILAHPDNKASLASARKFGFVECEPLRDPEVEPQVCMKLMRNK